MSLKSLLATPWAQSIVGASAAAYLRLVRRTSRFVQEPSDFRERLFRDTPIIATMWHGQHFMMPFLKPPGYPTKVLISRHRDGEINAIAAEKLGLGILRGSGDPEGRFDRKGGVAAFKALLQTLQSGISVAVTADVPKISRVAGLGIVMLARASQRPIYPVGIATSRRITFNNWDKSSLNLPFGRFALVTGDPIWVPRDLEEAELEVWRCRIEAALNAADARAYAITDDAERIQ